MRDRRQLQTTRWIARLERWAAPLLAAYESRTSGRLFAIGMVAGSLHALVAGTPPWIPLICLILWPLASALLCIVYLVISAVEVRLLRTVGLGAGLVLHLLFLTSMSFALLGLMYPQLMRIPSGP